MDKDSKESQESTEWSNQVEDRATEAAKKRAVRILGDRYMSKSEIIRRLIGKGETEEAAEAAAGWLEGAGAINDAEYASMIGRHYTAKGYGAARVRDELFRRGIPREMWDDVPAAADSSGAEEVAVEFIGKKLNGSVEKGDLRRVEANLQRRGFSYDEARAAISRYLECLEEAEGEQ